MDCVVYENEKTSALNQLHEGHYDKEVYRAALRGARDCRNARLQHHDVFLPPLEIDEA